MISKPTRGGLAALIFGLVVAILIAAPFFAATAVHAQAPAEAPAAAAPAAEAAPPACDAKTLEKCTPNSGDTAWMLTSVALVLMMTVPGLGLFYGGMVRKKNVGDTVMTSFAITALVTVIWTVCTYSMAFRAGTPFIGGLDRAFLQGILSDISKGIGNPNPLAPTIPETVYICFQMTFAIITPALIAGAFAERMKFSAMLWFIGLWAIFVYAPIAHWVWGPDGFMNSTNSDAYFKVLDFAGGTVVHVNAGRRRPDVRAHARQAQGHRPGPQHGADLHRRLAAVGRLVRLQRRLGGDRRHAGRHGDDRHPDRDRGRRLSPGCSSNGRIRGKPTVVGICSGAVAGLVAITPASGFVGPAGALAIGAIAGIVCYSGLDLAQAACSAMTTRSTASAFMAWAAPPAPSSPACSRSASTAAPRASSRATPPRWSTSSRVSASSSSTTPSYR